VSSPVGISIIRTSASSRKRATNDAVLDRKGLVVGDPYHRNHIGCSVPHATLTLYAKPKASLRLDEVGRWAQMTTPGDPAIAQRPATQHPSEYSERLGRDLERLLGEGSIRPLDLADEYLHDSTEMQSLRGRADAVAMPANTQQVAELVAWCLRTRASRSFHEAVAPGLPAAQCQLTAALSAHSSDSLASGNSSLSCGEWKWMPAL